MAGNRISWPKLLAFAGVGLPATLLASPIFSVLPGYYVLHTGADMAAIGAVLLGARLIDAVADPVIGVLSDRTRGPLGARAPWVIGGALLALPAIWFLYLPPQTATAFYFLIASTAAFLAWSMMGIPHNAWAAELTDDYDERSRIFGVKTVLATIGGFAFFLVPPALAPFTGTTEITTETMQAVAALLFILLPLSVFAAIRFAPIRPVVVAAQENPASWRGALASLTGNRPLLLFVAITCFAGIAIGMSTGLGFLYMDYMQLEAYFFLTSIAYALASVVSLPLWLWICKRFGKHRPWAWAMIANAVLGLGLFLLEPGEGALVPLIVLFLALGITQGVGVAIPSSMLADISDYEKVRSGRTATGNYFSLLVLLSKVNAAVGTAVGFWLAQSLGFAPGSQNAWGLLVALAGVPAVLGIVAGVLALAYPLDRRRQALIAARLASLSARAARA